MKYGIENQSSQHIHMAMGTTLQLPVNGDSLSFSGHSYPSLISSTARLILATPPKHFPAARSFSRHADPRAVISSKREWRSLVCRIVSS